MIPRSGLCRGFCLFALMVFLGHSAFAFGKKEDPKTKALPPGQTSQAEQESGEAKNPLRFLGEVTVSGRVRLVGSALFSHLVISDAENRDWYISSDEQKKLASFEQRGITVKGNAFAQDLILANGENIGIRYTLRDIVIGEPKN